MRDVDYSGTRTIRYTSVRLLHEQLDGVVGAELHLDVVLEVLELVT